ncbi:MAG TPA: hypothetical protein VKD90_27510 [Gemmataceae bacterium]|nr:hypothetical protein [Gemmataceae bacterium]
MDDWPFDDAKNTATLTVRQLVHGGQPILLVFHDADDGMWQFLTGETVDMSDAMLVSLESIYRRDPSVGELADLPLGWQASRASRAGRWNRQAFATGECR